jgi:FtsH-binding integral membrane protein
MQSLRKVALLTLIGLSVAAVVGATSMFTLAPALFAITPYAGFATVLITWAVAHWVCRGMVYGSMKGLGFALACVCEGISFGFLLLSTVAMAGVEGGILLVAQALGLVAATAGGMLAYVWFNKGSLNVIGAFLSMAFVPMLILMAISWFFPVGGTFGIIISGAFVVVSAAGLLYKLNQIVHSDDGDHPIEAAYELTMSLLVLLWNLIVLLNRLRR